jgi:hypothetical protein
MTMWLLVGASPTGPTSIGQPDVEDLEAGSLEEELSAPTEPGSCLACHCYMCSTCGTKVTPPGNRR